MAIASTSVLPCANPSWLNPPQPSPATLTRIPVLPSVTYSINHLRPVILLRAEITQNPRQCTMGDLDRQAMMRHRSYQIPLHRRKPVPTAKMDPGLRRKSAEETSSCINWMNLCTRLPSTRISQVIARTHYLADPCRTRAKCSET